MRNFRQPDNRANTSLQLLMNQEVQEDFVRVPTSELAAFMRSKRDIYRILADEGKCIVNHQVLQ